MMVTPSVKLVRPLGEGGMGAVWVADHLALRTQVVVKFIASGLKSSKEAHDRFSREAAAASQVKSPHVVQTFDHGITADGVPYIVMELLDGRDLGQYLDQEGKISPELVVEIVGQLGRALDRAHEKGIIHRDIKPGNIYLCDAGRDGDFFVKLLDFGIAKGVEMGGIANRVDSGTKTGSMIGSPFYMSPEQILGSKDIDHRSDLWSVGVLAYEMLTGRKPFDAETMGGLAIRIHSEPLPLPSVTNPELPPELDAWFAKACSRDVSLRFDNAKSLTEELARAVGGESPRSFDNARSRPRISTGSGGRPVNAVAATLPAGAATDAGVVRGTTQNRARSRILVLVGIVLVVMPASFFLFRALVTKDGPKQPTALVQPSVGAAGAGAGGSAATTASTPAVPPATSAPPTVAATPPSAEPSVPATPTTKAGAGHGTRPRPPSSAHTAASPDRTALPSPATAPVTTTPPKPGPSGHDIF